jgi:hypothetical protein
VGNCSARKVHEDARGVTKQENPNGECSLKRKRVDEVATTLQLPSRKSLGRDILETGLASFNFTLFSEDNF